MWAEIEKPMRAELKRKGEDEDWQSAFAIIAKINDCVHSARDEGIIKRSSSEE
jgi:hypothetical protein